MAWKELTREQIEKTKNHFVSGGYILQWYAMASEVILTTMGPDWWKKHCCQNLAIPGGYLKTEDKTEDGRYDHQDLVIKLGHMLYALRHRRGYDYFVESLKLRDLQPAFFELRAAILLQNSGFNLEFVQESGAKGERLRFKN